MAAKAGKKRVMVPHKLNNGSWQGLLGVWGEDGEGRWEKKQFATKSAEQDFCNAERPKKTGSLIEAWEALDAHLRKAGAGTLVEIGTRVLKDTNAIKQTGTAKECLDRCHQALVADKLSGIYTSDILERCGRFLRWYGEDKEMSKITSEVMIAYFATLTGKATTDRRAVSAWMGWAADEHWLADNPCKRKRRRRGTKGSPKSEAVVMSPSDAARILKLAVDAEEWVVLGFLAISLFGGVRPEEFRKRAKNMTPLDWTWDCIGQDNMTMPPALAKTGIGRVIPINKTLAAWLRFLREKRGILSGPILAAGKRGGWRPKWDNFRETHWIDDAGVKIAWNNDQLRHSYGSYSLAQSKDAGAVSLAMGNPPATLFKHYWNWKTLAGSSDAFFKITPEKFSKKGLQVVA